MSRGDGRNRTEDLLDVPFVTDADIACGQSDAARPLPPGTHQAGDHRRA